MIHKMKSRGADPAVSSLSTGVASRRVHSLHSGSKIGSTWLSRIKKRGAADIIFDFVNFILMTFVLICTLYPFLYVFFASLSIPGRFIRNMGILFFPRGFSLEGYRLVFKNEQIFVGFINTFIYLTAGLGINMVMTCLCAYALSRKGFMLKRFITFIILFTMYFSGGLVPFYLLVRELGMLNSRSALIFPTAINTFNMIVLRTAFANIPASLEESARMDGANDFLIMTKVVIPLSTATIMVIGLYYAVEIWNAWFNASIFINKRELFPLQLVLREILITAESSAMAEGMSDVNQDIFLSEIIKYATIIITIVPILLVYPFIQKYFVKGVMIGAIKG